MMQREDFMKILSCNIRFRQEKISGHIHVEFENSYEKFGPFGAKSIGEVVINTPLSAIAHAIYNATGHRFREPQSCRNRLLCEENPMWKK